MPEKYHTYIRKGWIVLLAFIVGAPLLSWSYHAPFKEAFSSSFFAFKLLGQLTGIVGVQLFAFSLILSGRLHSIEKLFGGLDKLYVIHHRVGVIAFSFLAAHPIILAFQYISSSVEDVANFLSPFSATGPVLFGMASILLMLILIGLTFYGVMFNYPKLKLAHRFLGGAFFLGFLHVLFIPSSLNSDIILKTFLVATSALGLTIFCYRTLLGSWLVPRLRYTISKINNLAGGVTEITLTASSTKIQHLPGQFGMLAFTHSPTVPNEEHPFTISSPGNTDELRFSIKGLGDYTKLLPNLLLGDTALVEGPFGEFSYVYGKEKQTWVAGGIGITPFVSMAEHMLTLDTLPYTVDLFYSVRTEADGTYKELFAALAAKHPSFVFHFMPSDTKGYITGELLLHETRDLHLSDIFVCGPPPLMAALNSQLLEINVPKKSIRMERFALLK